MWLPREGIRGRYGNRGAAGAHGIGIRLSIVATSVLIRSRCGGAQTSLPNCGKQAGGKVCAEAACCSQHGFCGSLEDFCGTGCQRDYGKCGVPSVASPPDPGRCPSVGVCPNNNCCSQFDYCSSDAAHCGVGCKSGPCFANATESGTSSGGVGVDGGGVAGGGGGGGSQGGAISSIATIPGIVASVVIVIFIAIFLAFLAWRIQRRRSSSETNESRDVRGAQDVERSSATMQRTTSKIVGAQILGSMRFSYKDLEKATNGFSVELGRGSYGVVYKGVLPDGTEVAVKKLINSQRALKDLDAEIKTLGSINHGNLVALRGFCYETLSTSCQMGQPFLVYEFAANGSLDQWIFGEKGKLLPWKTRSSIAKGTAKGLAYLHEELQVGKIIIHLDVKPENILLNEKFVPKVADFGLAKLVGETKTHTYASGGTFGYMAPEIYTGAATSKLDVYSFGIVLLELAAGRRRVDRSAAYDAFFLPAWATRKLLASSEADVVDPRLRGNFDAVEAKQVITVALLCLQKDPDKRPDMGEVLKLLYGIRVPDVLPFGLLQDLEMTERLIRRSSLSGASASPSSSNSSGSPRTSATTASKLSTTTASSNTNHSGSTFVDSLASIQTNPGRLSSQILGAAPAISPGSG